MRVRNSQLLGLEGFSVMRKVIKLLLVFMITHSTFPYLNSQAQTIKNPDPYEVIIQVADKISHAAVFIHSVTPKDSPWSETLGTRRYGTGVIIDPRGYILTATYIVLGANKITVSLADDRKYTANLTGYDFFSGLALIQIQAKNLTSAELGQSKNLRIGQLSIVISSSSEKERLVSNGIISGFTSFVAPWEYKLDQAIQTTAVNPGFWGGSPVLDASGKVVGIVSERSSQTLTTAIPVDFFRDIKNDLITKGRIISKPTRPWLGINSVPIGEGLGIRWVTPDGPASRSGIKAGDIITHINGKRVAELREFYNILWERKAGDDVVLNIIREGESLTVKIRSGDRDDFVQRESKSLGPTI